MINFTKWLENEVRYNIIYFSQVGYREPYYLRSSSKDQEISIYHILSNGVYINIPFKDAVRAFNYFRPDNWNSFLIYNISLRKFKKIIRPENQSFFNILNFLDNALVKIWKRFYPTEKKRNTNRYAEHKK
nr:MAG TPA: hypothetical protein [Caudoviricetes sp.]